MHSGGFPKPVERVTTVALLVNNQSIFTELTIRITNLELVQNWLSAIPILGYLLAPSVDMLVKFFNFFVLTSNGINFHFIAYKFISLAKHLSPHSFAAGVIEHGFERKRKHFNYLALIWKVLNFFTITTA